MNSMNSDKQEKHGPLAGYRILDMSVLQNGPFAAVMLSDMGADVIKIESADGDQGRNIVHVPTDGPAFKVYFETMNRNKRAIALDLKHPHGRAAFYRLVENADVVLQNYRAGVAVRLGADYESLRRVNPRIIRAANTGFGPLGPDADMPVADHIGAGRSGFAHVMGDADGSPSNTTTLGFADQIGAIILAYSVILALIARERFGKGQNVETSQLGAMMILLQSGIHQAFRANQQVQRISRNRLATAAPMPRQRIPQSYKGSDGEWVMTSVHSDLHWPMMCKLFGREELITEPRFSTLQARESNAAATTKILDEGFALKSRQEWVTLLRHEGVAVGPVQKFVDLLSDPQCSANNYLVELYHPTLGKLVEVGVPINFSETPGKPRSTAPEFGQHTREILLEHGFSVEEIEKLYSSGAAPTQPGIRSRAR